MSNHGWTREWLESLAGTWLCSISEDFPDHGAWDFHNQLLIQLKLSGNYHELIRQLYVRLDRCNDNARIYKFAFMPGYRNIGVSKVFLIADIAFSDEGKELVRHIYG